MAVVAVFFASVVVFFLFFRGRRIFIELYQERASRTPKQSDNLLQEKIR